MTRDRIRELCRVKASELQGNPLNWRKHPDSQKEALQSVLDSIGWADALVVRELEDGTLQIIDGHLRKDISGDEEVPVLVVDVDENEANQLLAVLDPLAAMAETDKDMLEGLLSELEIDSEGMQKLLDELSAVEGITPPDFDPTDEEEQPQLDTKKELPSLRDGIIKMSKELPIMWARFSDLKYCPSCGDTYEEHIYRHTARCLLCDEKPRLLEGEGPGRIRVTMHCPECLHQYDGVRGGCHEAKCSQCDSGSRLVLGPGLVIP